MMDQKILISAYNINAGGGRLLLESLLATLPRNSELSLYADFRLRNAGLEAIVPEKTSIIYVPNNLIARIRAEYEMTRISENFDKHLCLGNLPPLFGSKSEVITYLHTRYIVDRSLDTKIPIRKLVITWMERIWFRVSVKKSQTILVQTPTMEFMAQECFGPGLNIQQKLFLPVLQELPKKTHSEVVFIYVASYDAHKNHQNLIEAWKILKLEGISPKLQLLFPDSVPMELMSVISDLNIDLVSNASREELYQYYSGASCLIHPSFYESLGIVLLEADKAGLDILAPEEDYVRDVVVPVETFDPYSSRSISRSVKRYLKLPDQRVSTISPSEFWKSL